MSASGGSAAGLPAPVVSALQRRVAETWDSSILPALSQYIGIPNKSPGFDPEWKANGHMDRAVELIATWCRERRLPGAKLEVVRLKDSSGRDRTPVILIEVPGQTDDTVLLYGHLDKQPEMVGWSEGLGPWTPVVRGDRLYGRGGADDGYAAFASMAALEALEEQKVPRARCVVLIEACEESGSYDLPAYVDHLAARIGTPSLVVCLDSGCGNYEQLWGTTSLRGIVGGVLSVAVLTEGVHSGDASGIVPTAFRIFRQLLSRLEDEKTGAIASDFHVAIPADRQAQTRVVAQVLGEEIVNHFPFVPGAHGISTDLVELTLNRTWRPTVTVVGIEGFPAIKDAGNVLLPGMSARLSVRIPPTLPADVASGRLKEILEKDPPCGAKVSFLPEKAGTGWNAPAFAPWLEQAIDAASRATFGKPAVYWGEGGSIPFMGMLGEKFPQAQFLITGLLGPGSNAHGPNEFLHLPTGKNLTSLGRPRTRRPRRQTLAHRGEPAVEVGGGAVVGLFGQLVGEEGGHQTEDEVGADVHQVLSRAGAPDRAGGAGQRYDHAASEQPGQGSEDQAAPDEAAAAAARYRAVHGAQGGAEAEVEQLVRHVVGVRSGPGAHAELVGELLLDHLRHHLVDQPGPARGDPQRRHAGGPHRPRERAVNHVRSNRPQGRLPPGHGPAARHRRHLHGLAHAPRGRRRAQGGAAPTPGAGGARGRQPCLRSATSPSASAGWPP